MEASLADSQISLEIRYPSSQENHGVTGMQTRWRTGRIWWLAVVGTAILLTSCGGGDSGGVINPLPDHGSGNDVACTPQCAGKQCGLDGCGGVCGFCMPGQVCQPFSGLCVQCQVNCTGKACGSDGCGGSCGMCPPGEICDAQGLCQSGGCVPNCTGKHCGGDGCGSTCGDCLPGEACDGAGQCIPCTADCSGKQCGDDSCGGTCGTCPPGNSCNPNGQCELCQSDCFGKQCGDDGCGSSCGTCPPGTTCLSGACVALEGACLNAQDLAVIQADPDRPTDVTASCLFGPCFADPSQACLSDCLVNGSNTTNPPIQGIGLTGACADCYVAAGLCGVQECLGPCADAYDAPPCQDCLDIHCMPAFQACSGLSDDPCLPQCTGKQCGSDGCDGTCGTCAPGCTCSAQGQCLGCGPCSLPSDWGPTGSIGLLLIATNPDTAGCPDFSGDGVGDNGLAVLATLLPEIPADDLGLVFEFEGVSGFDNVPGFDLNVLTGDAAGSAGTWWIDPASYDTQTCQSIIALPALIESGILVAGPGNIDLELPMQGVSLAFTISDAQVTGEVEAGVYLYDGILAGVLTKAEAEEAVTAIKVLCAVPNPSEFCQYVDMLDLFLPSLFDLDRDPGIPGNDAASVCLRFDLVPATILGLAAAP